MAVAPLPGRSLEALPLLSLGHGTSSAGPLESGHDLMVRGLLGEGGMGRVLLGVQRAMDREVALKTLKTEATEAHATALVSEGVISGQLEHPNIIPVHQLGRTAEGQPLLVMKRVQGTTWGELLRDESHPTWPQLLSVLAADRLAVHLEVLMQVCQALDFAHTKGIVHLDVKPDNVMVGDGGDVYLVDWGVATRFEPPLPRSLVGTPAFLPPELLDESLPLGPPADVFLLGGALHFALTGTTRHTGASITDALQAAYRCEPPRYGPEVPEELAALCTRATNRAPNERLPSARAFRQALKDFLAHRGSLQVARAAAQAHRHAAAAHGEAKATTLAEARFGFTLALQQWPENGEAKHGLRATLESAIALELERENAKAARSLLAALGPLGGPADGTLSPRVEALERALAEREASAKKLEAFEQQRDFTVSESQRRRFLAVLVVPTVLVSFVVVGSQLSSTGLRPIALAWVALGLLAVAALSLAIGRRSLLRNAANRQFIGTFVAGLVMWNVNRWLGVRDGTPLATIVRGDLLIVAVAMVALGLVLRPLWLIGAALMVVVALVTSLWPDTVYWGLSIASLAILWFAAMPTRRQKN